MIMFSHEKNPWSLTEFRGSEFHIYRESYLSVESFIFNNYKSPQHKFINYCVSAQSPFCQGWEFPFISSFQKIDSLVDDIKSNNLIMKMNSLLGRADHIVSFSEDAIKNIQKTRAELSPQIAQTTLALSAGAIAKAVLYVTRFIRSGTWIDRILVFVDMFLDVFMALGVMHLVTNAMWKMFFDQEQPAVSYSVQHENVTFNDNRLQYAGLSQTLQTALKACSQVPNTPLASVSAEFGEAPPVFKIFSGLVVIASAIVIQKLPRKDDVTSMFKEFSSRMGDFGKISNGLRGLVQIYHQMSEGLAYAFEQMFGYYYPEQIALREVEKQFDGITSFMTEVNSLDKEDIRLQCIYDDPLRERIFKLRDLADSYFKVVSKIVKTYPSFNVLFTRSMNQIVRLSDDVVKLNFASRYRIDPFCVCLYGAPGVGKSAMCGDIIDWIANQYGAPLYNRVFSRNTDEKFWSNYFKQFAIMYDDFGQILTETDSPYGEFINVKSNNPRQINMADVKEKGRMFDSKLLVLTTNTPYPNPNEVANKEALWRRRNVLIEMKSDLQALDLEDPDDTSHWKFDILNSIKPGATVVADLSYDQLKEWILNYSKRYYEIQHKLVEKLNRIRNPPYQVGMPHGVINIEPSVTYLKTNNTLLVNAQFHVGHESEHFDLRWTYIRGVFLQCPGLIMAIRNGFIPSVHSLQITPVYNMVSMYVGASIFTPLGRERVQALRPRQCTSEAVHRFYDSMTCYTSFTSSAPYENSPVIQAFADWMCLSSYQVMFWFEHALLGDWDAFFDQTPSLIKDAMVYFVCKETGISIDEFFNTEKLFEVVYSYKVKEHYGFDRYSAIGKRANRVNQRVSPLLLNCNTLKEKLPKALHHLVCPFFRKFMYPLSHVDENGKERESQPPPAEPNLQDRALRVLITQLFDPTFTQDYVGRSYGLRPCFCGLNRAQKDAYMKQMFIIHARTHLKEKEAALNFWDMDLDWGRFDGQEVPDDFVNLEEELFPEQPFNVFIVEGQALSERQNKIMNDFALTNSTTTGENLYLMMSSVLSESWAIHEDHEKQVGLSTEVLTAHEANLRDMEIYSQGDLDDFKSNRDEWIQGLALIRMRKSFTGRIGLWMEEHPHIATACKVVAGLLATAGIVTGMWSLLGGSKAGEDDEIIEGKLYHTEAKTYHRGETQHLAKAKKVTTVRAQSLQDSNAVDIIQHRLLPNMWRIRALRVTKSQKELAPLSMNCFRVCGNYLLLNYHLFHNLGEGSILELIQPNGVKFEVAYDETKVQRCGMTDVCLYDTYGQVQPAKDNRSFFINESDLKYLTSTPAQMVGIDNALNFFYSYSRANAIDQTLHYALDVGDTIVRRGFTTECETYAGLCGSLLVQLNPKCPRKILGIHSAGYHNMSRAITSLVTQDMINDAIFKMSPPIVEEETRILDVLGQHGKEPKIEIEGNFSYLGDFSVSAGSPTSTFIRPSPLQGIVPFEPQTAPSVLNPKDPRMEFPCDPLARGIEKYGIQAKPFPIKDERAAISSVINDCLNMTPLRKPQLLTLHEAINGIPELPYFDRIDMKSSPGFPYVKFRPASCSGKEWLFKKLDEFNYEMANPTLRHNYERRHANAKLGIVGLSIWTDCLKDERRPWAKIRIGKTRTFCMPPVDYTLMMRVYYMDFCAAFYNSRHDSFHSVGIDPYSSEWTKVFDYLKEVGPNGFDGDFSNWDGKAMARIMFAFADMVSDWYNDGEQNRLVRRTLMMETIHTISLARNKLYQKHQGVPSGSAITVIINTFINAVYFRIAWRCLMREAGRRELISLDNYKRLVRDKFFGDDNLFAVHPSVIDTFNRLSCQAFFARFGITYTPAKKTDLTVSYNKIEDLQFLKCGFVPHPRYPNRVLAPMDITTIQELLNWQADCLDPKAQMYSNIQDCLRFSYHHGSKYYNRMREIINMSLREIDAQVVDYPYDDWEDLFFETFINPHL